MGKKAGKDDIGFRNKCICQRCPTYNDCMRKSGELLYCLEKKSSCKMEKYGCVCPSCPVASMKGFGGAYFCQSGKAVLE